MSVCRRIELGRHGSIPEFKVEWEGAPVPKPIGYTRTSSLVAYGELCGPEPSLNDVWPDVASCAISAAGAIGIAAIVAGPTAILESFQAAFLACLAAKIGEVAKEYRIAISVLQEPNGPWRRM